MSPDQPNKKCSGCESKAVYRVNEYRSCKRHLTKFCDMFLAMTEECQVEKLND
jgi:hypothetical protein